MSKTKFRVAYLLLRWNKALWLAFESHVTSYSALFQRSYSKICLTLDQGPGHSYFKTALLTKRSEKNILPKCSSHHSQNGDVGSAKIFEWPYTINWTEKGKRKYGKKQNEKE